MPLPPRRPRPGRSRAKARLRIIERGLRKGVSGDESLRLLHELQTYQVETEAQTEELVRLREEADTERQRYLDLYQHAPVGYLAVDAGGTILEANPTACRLFDAPRESVLARRLAIFADPEARGVVRAFLQQVLASTAPESAEFPFLNGGTPRWLRVDGTARAGARECRLALTDVTDRRAALDEAAHARSTLEHHVAERTEQLTRLHRLAMALSAAASPDEVFDAMLKAVAGTMGSTAGLVARLNPATGQLVLAATLGFPRALTEAWETAIQLEVDMPVTEAVARRRLVVVPSGEEMERRYPLAAAALRTSPFRAYVCAPVAAGQQVLGAYALAFAAPRTFAPADEDYLLAVGGHCGDALYRAELYQAERLARVELTELSGRLVAAQEQERRRVAHELHDQIGQDLTLARLALRGNGAPAALHDAREAIDRLLTRVRSLSLDLHPTMLDDLGLLAALLWLVERVQAQAGIDLRLAHSGLDRRYDPAVEVAAFRIVQEALTNVARHAQAARAVVHAVGTADDIRLVIADEGCGFDRGAAPVRTSLGLVGMQEHATRIGGELTIESARGRGTRIVAFLPARPEPPRRSGDA